MIYGEKFLNEVKENISSDESYKEYNKFIEDAKKIFSDYNKELDETISIVKDISSLEKQLTPNNCQSLVSKIYNISRYESDAIKKFNEFNNYWKNNNYQAVKKCSSDKNNKVVNKENIKFFEDEFNKMKLNYEKSDKMIKDILIDIERKEKKYGVENMNCNIPEGKFPASIIILEACRITMDIFISATNFKNYILQFLKGNIMFI